LTQAGQTVVKILEIIS